MTDSSGRRFKNAIYDQFARIAKGLASPRRLELLDLLCQAPRTVEALGREAGQSIANTSQHLQVLRAARLVATEKKGQYVTYRIADNEVRDFFLSLRRLAKSRLAEIDLVTREFLEARGAMELVDSVALVERVRQGAVTVLDVRPKEEYDAGHIPGAISVPLSALEARLAQLPSDRDVVAYCRGPYCVLAVEAVAILRSRGFQAMRLEDGVSDWQARGFEVVVGEGPTRTD